MSFDFKFLDDIFDNGLWLTLIFWVCVIVTAILLIKLGKRLTKRIVKRGRVDATNVVFVQKILKAVIITVAVIAIFIPVKPLKGIITTLLASSGVVALIAGFAAQEAMANMVGGMFISTFKPFALGDRVSVNGIIGVVEDITLRHTVIRTFENTHMIIPNSIMNSEMIENSNFSDLKVWKTIDLGIGYDSDVNHAIEVIQEVVRNHEEFIDNRSDEDKAKGAVDVPVRLMEFGDSSLNLRVWVWCKNAGMAFDMLSDIRISILEAFRREEIEIPFPQVTINTDK